MDLIQYRQAVDQELRIQIGSDPSGYYDMMRYHMGWSDVSGKQVKGDSGKLIRPVLCLLSCQAVGGTWEKALPAAAAIELVHNFSLIHDDIEDSSRYRRHRRTVWDIWGQAQAINAGDGMYTLSRLGATRLAERGHNPQKVLDFIRLLDETCLALCEGQYSDMSFETRYDVSVDEYMDMISKKTADLISCSMKAGAMLGTDSKSLVKDMGSFGFNMGMAFQIQDDILGIWGAEDKTGKSSSDIAQKKKSLPVVYALQSKKSECKNVIRSVYDREQIDAAHEKKVVAVLDDIGAADYCERLALKYYDDAVKVIESVRIDDAVREELLNIASFIVKRDY